MIYQSFLNQNCYAVQITDNNGLVKVFKLYYYDVTTKHEKQQKPRLNLPRISFSKLDYVLRKHFYRLAFPVIRSHLWICSKQLSKLGEKPILFSSSSIVDRSSDVNLSEYKKLTENFVMKFQDSSCFSGFSPGDFHIFRRFCEFNLEEIKIKNSEIANYELKLLFTPKIISFDLIGNTEMDIYDAISLTPNIQRFDVLKKLENGWEERFATLKCPKLKRCYINFNTFNDPKSFHSFLEQYYFRPHIIFFDNRIEEITIDDNFLQYFEPVKHAGGASLTFLDGQFKAKNNYLEMFVNVIMDLLFFLFVFILLKNIE